MPIVIYPGALRSGASFQMAALDNNYLDTDRVGANFTLVEKDVSTLSNTYRSTNKFTTSTGIQITSRSGANFVSSIAGALWTFSQVNPSLWLKADSNVSTIGGNVSTWEDFRSNGKIVTQSSASLRPPTSTLNSRQVIDMAQGKELDIEVELTNVRSALVLVTDVRPSDNSSTVSSLFQEDSSALPAQGAFVRVNNVDYTINISNVGGDANTGSASVNGGSLVTPNPASPLINLGVFATTGSGPYIFYIQYDNNQRVGRFGNIDSGGTQRRGDNHIAEYVFIDRVLTSSEIDKAVGRLAHDWSITSVLPSDHPYKTEEPTI